MRKDIIDIHSHIMPGVDDGARSLDESMSMLKMAEKENIRKIILTPHQKSEWGYISVSDIEDITEKMRRTMKKMNIDIELYSGSELFYCHDLKEKLEKREVCTLAGSHYILVEFMPNEQWSYIRTGLYRLVCAGYRPVLAHLERYGQVVKDFDRVQELVDIGCYIQVNAGSVTGEYGWRTKRLARQLIKYKMVHFLGTDAHSGTGKRVPRMGECAEWLYRSDKEYAEKLLWKNAEKIFSDAEIDR